MSEEIDFEAHGLLDGLSGHEERAARVELLEYLLGSGADLDEVKRAVAEDRLAVLPTERFLRADCRYDLTEVAKRSGMDESFILADWMALGLSRPAPDERVFTEADLSGFVMLKQIVDAGVPDDSIFHLARVFGRSSAQAAESLIEVFSESFRQAGDTEAEIGLRFAEIVSDMSPLLGPLVENAVRLHLREQIAHRMVSRAELLEGRLPGARPAAICFVDLVGFTSLSERTPAEELGRIADRFNHVVGEVAEAPVRLVKLIGDGAMLTANDPEPLVTAALELTDRARGAELPPLRVGVAYGDALNRGGDLYGRSVNLASRICEVAPPGRVVADAEVQEATREQFRWSHWRDADLKGIDSPVRLFQLEVQPMPEPDGEKAPGGPAL